MKETERLEVLRSNEGRIKYLVRSFVASTGMPVEDLQQEARVAAWRAIQSWRPDGGASMTTLIVHCVMSQLMGIQRNARRNKRTAYVTSIDAPLPGQDENSLHDRLGTPAEQAENVERVDLYRRIRALPEKDRTLILEYLDGVPAKRTAERLGVSRAWVHVLHKDVVGKLARMPGPARAARAARRKAA